MGETRFTPPKTDPRAQQFSRRARDVARQISADVDRAAGAPMMWSLIVWPHKKGELVQYIGNVARPEATKALEELLERWKSDMPDIPLHERQ